LAHDKRDNAMKRTREDNTYPIQIRGEKRRLLEDVYHWFLRAQWRWVFLVIACLHLALNALFGCAFYVVGGVQNLPNGSFVEAFFFSVQTFGTIGYGAEFPNSGAAHVLVTAESLLSLIFSALVTGIVFAKFSRPLGRIVFSDKAVVSIFQGKPTLMFRIGNERKNRVVEATIHVDYVRTERDESGAVFYRQIPLTLVRSRIAALSRSWSVLHEIGPGSPLMGKSPDDMLAEEGELSVSVTGLDDTTGQTMHGLVTYETHEIAFGARFKDVLTIDAGGAIILDLANFDRLEPAPTSAAFPYSWSPGE
jgi:inward rectifier potassium channel